MNDAFNLIASAGSGGYDGIAAIEDAAEDPSDGADAADIELLLDGDSGASGEQNPADGTVVTDFGAESGNGAIAITFTATGAADVKQIALTRAAPWLEERTR